MIFIFQSETAALFILRRVNCRPGFYRTEAEVSEKRKFQNFMEN